MRSCTRFLAACALATFAGNARAEDKEVVAQKVAVTLDEVRAFPEAYRRVPFELELLYHGPRSLYNPFFTIFEPSAFANFAAWPGDAAIFEREHYVADHPLFYVDRRNEELQRTILALQPYTWFRARCIVRSVAQERAWIEVLSVASVGARLDPTDLRHLVRAQSLAAGGEFERALVEIEMAKLFGAPPRFVGRARREEGRVALAANQPERAMMALQQAWVALPEDKLVAALLDRASAQVAMLRMPPAAAAAVPPAPTPAAVPAATPAKSVTTPAKTDTTPVKPLAAPAPPATTPPATTPPATPATTPPAGELPAVPAPEPSPEPSTAPAKSAPQVPAPAEPAPAEPMPAAPTPTGPLPADPVPADETPGQPTPSEPEPAPDAQPVDELPPPSMPTTDETPPSAGDESEAPADGTTGEPTEETTGEPTEETTGEPADEDGSAPTDEAPADDEPAGDEPAGDDTTPPDDETTPPDDGQPVDDSSDGR